MLAHLRLELEHLRLSHRITYLTIRIHCGKNIFPVSRRFIYSAISGMNLPLTEHAGQELGKVKERCLCKTARDDASQLGMDITPIVTPFSIVYAH